jgi:hypothetical protein
LDRERRGSEDEEVEAAYALQLQGRGNVAVIQKIRESRVRPLFFRNSPISLAGDASNSAAGVTMIGYWLLQIVGRPNANPYLGIIFFLLLPALSIAGLLLIPVGFFLRRRKLQKAGEIPLEFPKVELNDRRFQHGLDIVLVATIVNLFIVAIAAYRGAAYMDSPQFCGQSRHVIKTIAQDCSVCHNLLAEDEDKPKVPTDLGIQ